jgi:hypothetical protein
VETEHVRVRRADALLLVRRVYNADWGFWLLDGWRPMEPEEQLPDDGLAMYYRRRWWLSLPPGKMRDAIKEGFPGSRVGEWVEEWTGFREVPRG